MIFMAKATPINFALAYLNLLRDKRGKRITPKKLRASVEAGKRIAAYNREAARSRVLDAAKEEAPPAQPKASKRALVYRERMKTDPKFKKAVLQRAANARAARWGTKTPKATVRPAKSLTNGTGKKAPFKYGTKSKVIKDYAKEHEHLNANQIALQLGVSPSYAYKVLHGYTY
jgi:hypothetical protein